VLLVEGLAGKSVFFITLDTGHILPLPTVNSNLLCFLGDYKNLMPRKDKKEQRRFERNANTIFKNFGLLTIIYRRLSF
jgi:hypothetical protein